MDVEVYLNWEAPGGAISRLNSPRISPHIFVSLGPLLEVGLPITFLAYRSLVWLQCRCSHFA